MPLFSQMNGTRELKDAEDDPWYYKNFYLPNSEPQRRIIVFCGDREKHPAIR
jgi:hypothetical protein